MTDRPLPGHHLGHINTGGAADDWLLEFSIALDADGFYTLYSRDQEGNVREVHTGTSGRALGEYAALHGVDWEELHRDLQHIDIGFARDFMHYFRQRLGLD
jgi:hypothetical protein